MVIHQNVAIQRIFFNIKTILFPDTDLTGHSIIPIELGEGIYQYLNTVPIQIKNTLLIQIPLSVCIMVYKITLFL